MERIDGNRVGLQRPSKNRIGTVRRFVIAAMLVALLPAPAYPQDDSENRGPMTVRSDKEKKQDAAIDKAYQDAMKRAEATRQSAKTDPWQSVRPATNDGTKR
jgi:uncharacterized protein YecT (DUF1311 family)